MSAKEPQPIEVGDRFETRDARDAGRIVEAIELPEPDVEGSRYRIQTEVHPRNPSAVGTLGTASERTLRKGYKRVSR